MGKMYFKTNIYKFRVLFLRSFDWKENGDKAFTHLLSSCKPTELIFGISVATQRITESMKFLTENAQ